MTQPRRDKDGNIIAGPIRKPRTIRKLKPGIAGIGLLPVKRRKKEIGERKAVKKPSPKATAKKVNKVQKQADGFEAIAKRKAARAKAAGKTYDIAKSNPRLAKKLKAKNRAFNNVGLTNRAAKKVNKLEKQSDGLAAIANRKSARTGRGITAKSNPRLFKKLVNKQIAANRIRNRNK